MRFSRMFLLAGAALYVQPALAADALKFGPPPAWVHPQPIPAAKPTEAPVAVLLHDEQIAFERGKVTRYTEMAFKIENAQGLAAGNLALVWQPATDTVTVNKVQIRRGDKVIDVLAGGQTFAVLRRETNLDAAMLDGTLTATMQPEGLQEGDVIDLATTTERSDPVLKGHVEAMFGAWDGLPIQAAHAALRWPSDLHLNLRETPGLPPPQRSSTKGENIVEMSAQDVQPIVPPNGAPDRFKVGRLAEATDYASWSDLANLMMPLFRDASAIPASGPLHDEVEKIRASSADPKARAAQALALVQDRVRYVALLMGQGGYVPASAEQTWSRRFGDCKAKTALLLGILHSLGIEAEPVLAQVKLGDMIADRLPMIELFNHVLVRAHIGGKDYWLDGTRTGDTDLDSIEVPDFGWGLPIVEHAQLVHMIPRPLERPETEVRLDVDASGGVYASAPATADQTVRGDAAVELHTRLASFTKAQLDEFLRAYWTARFDFLTFKSGGFSFDKDKRELHLTATADAKLDWTGGYFHVPESSVGYHPKFDRQPGPLHDVPFAVDYPTYNKSVVRLKMPASFLEGRTPGSADVHETIAGIEYNRTSTVAGDTLTVETSARSLVPEISYKEAKAAEPRLLALDDEDVALPMPRGYRSTEKDLAARIAETPGSASEYVQRGDLLIEHGKYDEASADFSKALQLEPKNVEALASRAIASASKNDYAAAGKDLAQAEAIEPENAVLLRARAFLAERRGDIFAAIDGYTKSLAKDPDNAFALFRRARLYQSDWKYDAAIADFTQILTRDSKNVGALSFRALAYAEKGDRASAQRDLAAARAIDPTDGSLAYAEAQLARTDRDSDRELAAYSKLLETAPVKGPILAERASAYVRLNRFDEALADTDQALKLGDTDVDLRLVRANIFMRKGNRAAVEAEADAMIRENPQSSLAWIAAGKSYQALGLHEKALAALNHALAMQPDLMAYLNRADVRPISDLDERLADIDAALKIEPNNADALMQKAYNLILKGDYGQALQLYDRAATIDVDPDNRSIPQGRAVALYKSGQVDAAKRILAELRAKAKSAGDFTSLCWTEARWDMFPEAAVRDCEQARKIDPKTSTDVEGFALLRVGRLDEAIAAFDKAIAESHGAFSYLARAIAYQRKGNSVQANADRAEALKLRPDEESVIAEYGLKFEDRSASASGAAQRH